MARYHIPGVAIAVVDASGPRLVRGFGHTDTSRRVPVDPTTVFEAASLGKPLFAYAVIERARQPGFDLDTPVQTYLQAAIAADPRATQITARNLLNHTSGIVYLESKDRRAIASVPGSMWAYSGLGYSVLQDALERVNGTSIDAWIRGTLATSLAMSRTGYLGPVTRSATFALGHARRSNALPPSSWPRASAASSLHTSASDYGRFLSHILAELTNGTASATAALMLMPHVAVDPSLDLSWGLGWAVARARDDTLFLHWGSNPGFKSLAVGSVRQGLGFVVLTNGDHGLELATALVPLVFGVDYPFLEFFMLHPDD